jgi:hypothetical protein
MLELLEDAGDELKRADHLVYVSLKYTRTADVLVNSLLRMIDAYEALFQALLIYAVDEKGLQVVPKSPIEKGNTIKKYYDESEILDNLDLYFLLRKITRSTHTSDQEYRRHVCIITTIDGREEIINIDIITQYLEFEKKFFSFMVNMLGDYAKKKYAEEESGWEK